MAIRTIRIEGSVLTEWIYTEVRRRLGRPDFPQDRMLLWCIETDQSHRPLAACVEVDERDEVPPPRTCNRHADCDAADELARRAGLGPLVHCRDEFCEDCFGR